MAPWRSRCILLVGMALAFSACGAGSRTGRPDATARSAPSARPAEPRSAGWPAPTGCREVAAQIGAMKERLPGSPSGAPLGVLILGDTQGLRVEQDVALPVADSGQPPSAPCLLVVELPSGPPIATRRRLGTDTVLSEYQSGTHERANPAYAEARREVNEAAAADRETSGSRLRSTGDLTLDLIGLAANGLIRGVGAYVDGHRSEAAQAKLAATPPTIEEPVYRPYRLTVEDIVTEKEVRTRAALVDRRSGEVWEAPRTVTARQEIEIAQGLHPRDRAMAEGKASYHAPAELRQWEQAPIGIDLSDLLAWTVSATATKPPGSEGLEPLLARWRSEAPPTRLATAVPVERGSAGPGAAARARGRSGDARSGLAGSEPRLGRGPRRCRRRVLRDGRGDPDGTQPRGRHQPREGPHGQRSRHLRDRRARRCGARSSAGACPKGRSALAARPGRGCSLSTSIPTPPWARPSCAMAGWPRLMTGAAGGQPVGATRLRAFLTAGQP